MTNRLASRPFAPLDTSSDHPLHQRHQTQPTAATAASNRTASPPARRDLIREYFARNATPPAIFKPSFQAFSPPPVLQLAYTHPALLLLDDDDRGTRAPNGRPDDKATETDRAVDETYVSDSSVEMLLDAAADVPERSRRPPSFRLRRSAFSSIDLTADVADARVAGQLSPDGGALPLGTVTANLIRTWEQLNAANAPAAAAAAVTTVASTSQPMLKAPVPLPRRSTTTASSHMAVANDNDFYDSIDDDDQFVSELERIPSMCCETDDGLECGAMVDGDGGAMAVAGEAMAQFESLDKRKICWSMDSV